MKLSDEQQQLLHAWVDGETTEAENQVVNELIADNADAQLYLTELKRVRELIATHGGVPAPEGLRERVLAALDADEAPVIKLPLFNWRTALVAAAAAVVVSLVLVFAPPTEETVTPTEVAVTEQPRSQTPPEDVIDENRDPGEAQWADPENNSGNGASTFPKDTIEKQPEQPTEEALPKPPSVDAARAPAQVLQLNAGLDAPFEVTLNLDRNREASIMQVYNDMLMVGSLHGQARVLDENSTLGEWTDGEEFAGRDFTVYDGVEVEVEAERVPELLSAINRLSTDQGYGNVILPGYMRAEVGTAGEQTRELQDAVEEIERASKTVKARKDSEPGAQGYLPSDVQRDSLRRLADDIKVDARLARLLEDEPNKRGKEAIQPATVSQNGGRKVKLVIRLR